MIVIIDSKYPFDGAEPFLADEIRAIKDLNKQIRIYPLGITGTDKDEAFPLYEGISVVNIINDINPAVRLRAVLHSFVDPLFLRDCIRVVKCRKPIRSIGISFIYTVRSNICTPLIIRDLKRQSVLSKDIVFYSYWMHFHAFVALKLKRRFKGSRFITRCHGYDLYEYRSRSGFLPGRDTVFKNADTVASVSDAGKDYLNREFQALHGKAVTYYLGTFDHGINSDDMKDGMIRIVSCSNLVEVKRVDLIIKALSNIRDQNVQWIHYGDGPLRNELEVQAEKELPENVEFSFKGFVPKNILMDEYGKTRIDLFINVSSSEGLPVSIMEAMSFGIPVIATDVGGNSEIVSDGYNGTLLNANPSPSDIAKEIRSMLSSDTDALRKNARRTWENSFDAAENYKRFYAEICNESYIE